MSVIPLIIAFAALLAAIILYFVFLPHVEGPSLEKQQPDRKSWLVQCPECGRWQTIVPRVRGGELQDGSESDNAVKNWYACNYCKHRWDEVTREP